MCLPAPPRQCIDLHFEENYSIESSWECKFDNIEVRDGPFGFSPMLGRYCGQHSPPDIRSSGRYLWIKFVTDGELEAVGFSASYNFTAGTSATFLFCMWTWLLWGPCCCIDRLSAGTAGISVRNTVLLAGDWFLVLLPSITGEVERWVILSCFSGLQEVESKLIAVVQHNGDISLSKACNFVICYIFGRLSVTLVMRALMARNGGMTWFNNPNSHLTRFNNTVNFL